MNTTKRRTWEKLNTHQWELYQYLKDLMVNQENRTTTIKEIVERFPQEYEIKITEGNKSNCPRIYEDLKAITMSDEVDMIVTLNHNRIRLGTELDVLKRLSSLIARTRWEQEEIRTIKAKIKNNGQFKLLSNAGIPLDKANQSTKAWHVAFSNDNLALTIKQLQQEQKLDKEKREQE